MTNFKRLGASILLATALAPNPASAWFLPIIEAINALDTPQLQAGLQDLGKTIGNAVNGLLTGVAGVNANVNANAGVNGDVGVNGNPGINANVGVNGDVGVNGNVGLGGSNVGVDGNVGVNGTVGVGVGVPGVGAGINLGGPGLGVGVSVGTSAGDCSANEFFYAIKNYCIQTDTTSNTPAP